MYTSKQKYLRDVFAEKERINAAKVKESYNDIILGFQAELEAHYRIMNESGFLMGPNAFSGHRKASPAILSCIHKSFFLYHSVLELTTKGLYGPARTLLRSIYESLVIAKFCSIDSTGKVLEKWEAGEYINLNKDVFGKLDKPPTDELRLFWKGLHELAHATTAAQQITLDFDHINGEILHNFSLMQVLLSCSYHLISRHWLSSSIIYYTNVYADKDKFAQARQVARDISKLNRSQFTGPSKTLLRQFCAKWEAVTNQSEKRKQSC